MLVLTRNIGEAIVIGQNVTVRILKIKGNQVRVGIEAPKEIGVRREEIPDRQVVAHTLTANQGPVKAAG